MKRLLLFVVSLVVIVGCSSQQDFDLAPASQSFKQNDLQFSKTLDILWVIDNSGSMQSSQDNLRNNLDTFLLQFVMRDMDFHMAVTTTDAYRAQITNDPTKSLFRDGSTAGGFTGYRIVTPLTPNFRSTMAVNLNQGIQGDGDERAFQSMMASLKNPGNTGFVRQNSFLAIIILSDEEDFSTDQATPITDVNNSNLHPINKYKTDLDTLVGVGDLRRYSVSAITIKDEACRQQLLQNSAGQRIGTRYMQLAAQTEGVVSSLCGNFADALNEISGKILELITGFKLDRIPKLGTIHVYINGIELLENAVNGWTYDSTQNMIRFHGSGVPGRASVISVNYAPLGTK